MVLHFDKTVNNLAGNRYGREVFCEQIKGNIDENAENEIEIPEVIEDVASSFVQGVYSELAEKHGKEKALKIMHLISKRPDVMKKITYAVKVYGI